MDHRQVEVYLCSLKKPGSTDTGSPAKSPFQTALLQGDFPSLSAIYISGEKDLPGDIFPSVLCCSIGISNLSANVVLGTFLGHYYYLLLPRKVILEHSHSAVAW